MSNKMEALKAISIQPESETIGLIYFYYGVVE
jgi:hypothetical protein